MKIKSIKKYHWEFAKLLKKGTPVTIKLSMRCNLNCKYCGAALELGKMPDYTENDYPFWVNRISELNIIEPINQIGISGGEPGLCKDLPRLVNYLIDNNYVVLIFTNLTIIDKFMKIKKSWKVRFIATYHESFNNLDKWVSNYNILKHKFHISTRELRKKGSIEPRKIVGSQITELFDESPDDYGRQIAPDGTMYFSCKQVSRGGK